MLMASCPLQQGRGGGPVLAVQFGEEKIKHWNKLIEMACLPPEDYICKHQIGTLFARGALHLESGCSVRSRTMDALPSEPPVTVLGGVALGQADACPSPDGAGRVLTCAIWDRIRGESPEASGGMQRSLLLPRKQSAGFCSEETPRRGFGRGQGPESACLFP